MNDHKTGPRQGCTKCTEIDHIHEVCDELSRVLRGHQHQPGLVASVAVLADQARRLEATLEEHVREYHEDRQRRQATYARVAERVILWLLVAVLSLTLAGGKLADLRAIADAVQAEAGGDDGARPPPP